MTESITRDMLIAAPPERIWAALSDHRQFAAWFGCTLDTPFAPGALSQGVETLYTNGAVPMALRIVAMEPPRYLSFRWPGYDSEKGRRLDEVEPWTLVEFRLAPEGQGTRVTVTESGFAAITAPLGDRMARENAGGWEQQLRNLAAHVA